MALTHWARFDAPVIRGDVKTPCRRWVKEAELTGSPTCPTCQVAQAAHERVNDENEQGEPVTARP